MVVSGTQAREDGGPPAVARCKFGIDEEGGQIKLLSLDEHRVDLVEAGEAEVPPVCRKHDRVLIVVEWTTFGIEFSGEKVVKM